MSEEEFKGIDFRSETADSVKNMLTQSQQATGEQRRFDLQTIREGMKNKSVTPSQALSFLGNDFAFSALQDEDPDMAANIVTLAKSGIPGSEKSQYSDEDIEGAISFLKSKGKIANKQTAIDLLNRTK